jgi:hypothetical protein
MTNPCSRRAFLKFAAAIFPVRMMHLHANLAMLQVTDSAALPQLIPDIFPAQPPELVREMVIVSHFDLKRVRELVERRPSLARAAWDWGFGDWETALGAASHMGNRPIAEYLVSKGARPSLFSAAMFGQLDVVKAFVAAQPGVKRIRGPHSISLLAHAKAGGQAARSVFEFLQSLGDADSDPEAPLSEKERAPLLGTYIFGSRPNQQIDVTMEHNPFLKTDQLTWTRKGAMGRPLYHLGNLIFYPAGAFSVRIRFAPDDTGMVMTVNDPDPVLAVRRRPPAQ